MYSDPSSAKTLKDLIPYRLDTLDVCVLHYSCLTAAAQLLPALSVYMEFDFDNYR